jgi:hypothetical protein
MPFIQQQRRASVDAGWRLAFGVAQISGAVATLTLLASGASLDAVVISAILTTAVTLVSRRIWHGRK